MRKFAVFLIVLMSLFFGTTVHAQNNQAVLDRADQAMAHLTQYLGVSTPITRDVHFWRWEERIYDNAAFGCGIPGETYPAQPNRALDITISYQGTDYDYRVSWDGSILVLCGGDGLPLYRSDAPDYNPSQAVTPLPAAQPTDAEGFYAWVFMREQQRLYLLGRSGELGSFTRPLTADEDPQAVRQMAMSRDGRYLVQATRNQRGEDLLTIYDIETDRLQALSAAPGESISLGLSFDLEANGLTGSPLIFSPDHDTVLVGLSDERDPSVNRGRVWVVELATGAIRYALNSTDLPAIYQGQADDVTDALASPGAYRAVPLFWGSDDRLHVMLIRLFTGGSEKYPTFAWTPEQGVARFSRLGWIDAGIAPDGDQIFTNHDPTAPASTEPSMMPPHNVIILDTPDADFVVRSGSDRPLYGARFAGEDRIIFRMRMDDGEQPRVVVRDLETEEEYIAPGRAVGVPGGVLAFVPASLQIAFYVDGQTPVSVWNVPPRNGDAVFVWSQYEGISLGLTSVAGQDLGTATGGPAPTPLFGGSDCGQRASIVSVGITARTTIDDGTPTNVRTDPTTSAQVAQIIPEGTRFRIIGGPTCADGYTWWQIVLDDGVVGWIAEAGRDFYFIEPAP
ncbi:MAG: SH3 domain-containing protein [Chloroflexota bacterium]